MIEFKHLLVPAACLLMGCMPTQASEKQNCPSVAAMEKLDRGVVALPAAGKGVFISWRMLGTDSKNVCFDVERDGKVIAHHIKTTNYTDAKRLAELSAGLGEAMVGINEQEISLLMAERGV